MLFESYEIIIDQNILCASMLKIESFNIFNRSCKGWNYIPMSATKKNVSCSECAMCTFLTILSMCEKFSFYGSKKDFSNYF